MNKVNNDDADELSRKAVAAMKSASARMIEEHRRDGRSIAVWENGKVVLLSTDDLTISESNNDDSNRSKR